jgi:hypothetical protein
MIWLGVADPARAHEVLPAIADMTRSGDVLTFDVLASLEGFVAGIDLAEVTDTNEAAEAATYDSLRAMDPAALEAAFRAFWPQMAEGIVIEADGQRLVPTLTSVVIPETGNIEIVRSSRFGFAVDLPEGAEAVVVGWDRSLGALVVRQMGVEAPYDGYLEPGATTPPITLGGGDQAGPFETFVDYIPVGFDHIVPLGLDHILFVLGLFFLSTQIGPLLWQISAFTLAHTITLALAALGYVTIPGSIVEPLIAASIVFVAVENIFARGLSPWRPAVIFGFGLLHGLGFASVLGEFGLPAGTFVPALIGFNVGVELGQLAVVAVAFLLVREAVRVDVGRNEAGLATALYGGGAVAAVALAAAALTVPGFLGGALMEEIPLWNFFVPLALLIFLCLLSVLNRDRIDAYRRIVAVPMSVAIALVGAWWFVERVFL